MFLLNILNKFTVEKVEFYFCHFELNLFCVFCLLLFIHLRASLEFMQKKWWNYFTQCWYFGCCWPNAYTQKIVVVCVCLKGMAMMVTITWLFRFVYVRIILMQRASGGYLFDGISTFESNPFFYCFCCCEAFGACCFIYMHIWY